MLMANRISVNRGLFDEHTAGRIERVCQKILGLPLKPAYFDLDAIVQAIRNDKKQISDELTAVLLSENMTIGIYHDVQPSEIKAALQSVQELLSII